MHSFNPAVNRRTDFRSSRQGAVVRSALLLGIFLCSASSRAELTLAEAERIAVERDAVTRQLAQDSKFEGDAAAAASA